ncbi:MAG: hypothetical protein HLUCCA01_08700 [Bacteroidetes bacterium HLUCCA01]|nr:MAG: hypothetical protein HLUCCA01_08700 [Bacteroidetes bacterium HLUCCA01]
MAANTVDVTTRDQARTAGLIADGTRQDENNPPDRSTGGAFQYTAF